MEEFNIIIDIMKNDLPKLFTLFLLLTPTKKKQQRSHLYLYPSCLLNIHLAVINLNMNRKYFWNNFLYHARSCRINIYKEVPAGIVWIVSCFSRIILTRCKKFKRCSSVLIFFWIKTVISYEIWASCASGIITVAYEYLLSQTVQGDVQSLLG